jgi:hypothetical protein
LRKLRILALLWLLFPGAEAVAAIRFVDGACATSGSGASLTCGASGPFRTINEGIESMAPGDTLYIRGAHDAFNGIYFDTLEIQNGSFQGKALACSAGSRCTISGCRTPICPADEVPTVRGMTLRTWTSLGGGLYSRTMEASPNTDTLPPVERDGFDPGILYQGTSYPLTPLGYAGDDVNTPADGKWSYLPATHAVRVNPIASADPATTIYVPHFGTGVYLASPSAYVTLAYLAFEGPRQKAVQIAGVPGLTLSHIRASYWNEHGIHTSGAGGAPGILIEDSVVEYGGRGISWAASNSDTAFAMRLFGADGGVVRRNVIRHIGSSGEIRLSCGPTCTNAHSCATCDAPWNTQTHTRYSFGGVAYQVKQTDGFTFEDNLAEDIGTTAMAYDATRHAVARRNTLRRTGGGFTVNNFTPSGGCPTTSTSEYCYSCDDDFSGNTIEDSGGALFVVNGTSPVCSINVDALTAMHTNCSYVAHITGNTIVRPRSQAVCGTSTALITIANNTVTNQSGGCGSNTDCADSNPCTADVCSAGVCTHLPGNESASCSDGNVCNGTETCRTGICQSSGALNCNDNNPCTTDGCQGSSGCTHSLVANCQPCATSGTCSDGNPCNGAETCVSGLCRTGTPLSCNDGNACTTDSCSSQTGCLNMPVGGCTPCTSNTQCDNGNACDGAESCSNGRCRNNPPPACDDGDPCTTDGCSQATGCTHALQPTCGSCVLPGQATLDATRVTIRRLGGGIFFRAIGLLEPASAVDPGQTGLIFDIRQPATGEIFYRAIVPGSALYTGAARNTVRLPRGTEVPTAPGLMFLRIRTLSTGRLMIFVFGRAQKMPSRFPTSLGWNVTLGDQCGSDSCTTYGRISDCG